ncbi:MAG: alkene reductase [Planctomycetota bacterium]
MADADTHPLLRPLKSGRLTFENRVWMAPLTRCRCDVPGNLVTPLHALYYSQRASAGLIISEATQISHEGQGYARAPGIHTDEQVAAWKVVTDAVHVAGGRIFCQLWHVGAISHSIFQPGGGSPVSSSAWHPEGKAYLGDLVPEGERPRHPPARALELDEMPRLLDDYRHAARCADAAGFDGVELHAANGYLIQQFLDPNINKRTDDYGGSVDNRTRLLGEVLDALQDVLEPDRIGVRLSPPVWLDAAMVEETWLAATDRCAGRGLSYLHVLRTDSFRERAANLEPTSTLFGKMKSAFGGPFVANASFDGPEATEWIKHGYADAIAFGRPFISNPDLPTRLATGSDVSEWDQSTFYGGGAAGYTDYPSLRSPERLNRSKHG